MTLHRTRSSDRHRGPASPSRRPLRLEALEDRLVPSMFTVNTLTDEQDGGTLANPAGPDNLLSLREAISAANLTSGPSSISLSSGTYSISLIGANEDNNATGDFDIKQSLTIQGAGRFHTFVDGAMLDRVFDIRGNINVTLQDLTIENGEAGSSNGGGIRVGSNSPNAQLTLFNVRIINNHAFRGAGIFFAGSNLTINGGGINLNNADANGGGIDITNASATVNITGTNFNTDATEQGPVSGLPATGVAGAIASNASLMLTNCVLTNNMVTGPGTPDQSAGAIAASDAATVTINSSLLQNNHIPLAANLGRGDAGAISSAQSIMLTDTTVTGNTAGNSTGAASGVDAGGIVCTAASVSLTRSHVDNNTLLSQHLGNPPGAIPVGNAGGIVADGIIGNNSSVNGNTAGQSIGMDSVTNAGGVLSFPTAVNGDMVTGGGAALFQCTINDNRLRVDFSNGNAGGLLAPGSIAMTNCSIVGNKIDTQTVGTDNAGGVGTGIFPGTASLTSCLIAGNSVGQAMGTTDTRNAGGLYFTLGVSMTSVTIRNNAVRGTPSAFAENAGGLLVTSFDDINLNDLTITGNSSDASGGGILDFRFNVTAVQTASTKQPSSGPATLTISNSLISGNTAASDGGGIECETSLLIDACTVSNNSAGTDGGGVSFEQPAVPLVRRPSVQPRIAVPVLTVKVTNSTFDRNTCGDNGGGFYLDAPNTIELTASFVNDTFVLNHCDNQGGALYFTQVNSESQVPLIVFIAYLTIDHNGAQDAGGGIYADVGVEVRLQDTIVANSTSGKNIDGNDAIYTDLGNNLSSDDATAFLTLGSDFNSTDPRLASLADNGGPTFTEALLFNSPAINTGATVIGVTTDQRSVTRPQGSAPDIGAYEFVPNSHLFAITSRSNGVDTSIDVFNANRVPLHFQFSITPFTGWQGQLRVAVADVNNDGVPDIIAGKGPGGDSEIRVFSGVDGSALTGPQYDFTAFPGWTDGVFLAAGDLNGDNHADIAVTKDVGGTARVKIFSGADGSVISAFNAFAPPFMGGSRPAIADVNGDGRNDLIIASGPFGPPIVEVFDGASVAMGSADFRMANGVLAPKVLDRFFAFGAQNYSGGLLVAAGDLDGDGYAEIVLTTANLPPSPDHLMVNNNPVDMEVVNGKSMAAQDFNIYPDSTDGVRVAILQDVSPAAFKGKTRDGENDTLSEIVTAPGAGGGSLGKILDGDSPTDPLIGEFTEPGGNPNGLCIAGH